LTVSRTRAGRARPEPRVPVASHFGFSETTSDRGGAFRADPRRDESLTLRFARTTPDTENTFDDAQEDEVVAQARGG
jgi:hypothetical protein